MNTAAQSPKSSRVKACSECRQQKLRCDASQQPGTSCTRCRRKGLKCAISAEFRRQKRQTATELRAELEALRNLVHNDQATVKRPAHQPPTSQSSHPLYEASPRSAPSAEAQELGDPSFMTVNPTITEVVGSHSLAGLEPTLPRSLNGVFVRATTIDDCFVIFNSKYSPQLPVVDGDVHPNKCYSQSPLLFWSILVIGSRKYQNDPTLMSLLVPQVKDLIKSAAFDGTKSLYTIQAFLLICHWPMPFNSLWKDITPIVSAVLLQHALSLGLHIFGIGQDFSRTKLQKDRSQIDLRARLWALCIVMSQRISCTDGTPPIMIPDSFDSDDARAQTVYSLPPAIRFQKTLSRILTESILELEKYALSKPLEQRAAALNPLIDAALLSLGELQNECPSPVDRFYLTGAELQVAAFHLLGPRSSFDDSRLSKMYSLACSAIELMDALNRTECFCDYMSNIIVRYLNLAAFTILKLSRCHLQSVLDVERGRIAYFRLIQIFKQANLDPGDSISRSYSILTQLWTSKNIFRKSDGVYDPLSIRCGSRLAMGILYDLFWWWRCEFAGIPDPYDESGSSNDDVPAEETAAAVAAAESVPPVPPSLHDLAPDSFLNDVTWWQASFPELGWPTSPDGFSL